jgi:release factor glutamine methyltransferase
MNFRCEMKPTDSPQQVTRISTIRIIEWTTRARQRLAVCSDTPTLEAELLIGHVKQRDRTWVLSHPEHWISPSEQKTLNLDLSRRLAGEPLPYILGEWEFFGHSFKITSSVLIPRPETEILIQVGLDWLQVHHGIRKAADIGTGSGAIAISLALEISDLQVTAMDLSGDALDIARNNAILHGVDNRINFLDNDLLSNDNNLYNLICANLPYIPTEDLPGLPVWNFEPHDALDGGSDGLQVIRRFLGQIPTHITTPGLALLEFQFDQADHLLDIVAKEIPNSKTTILKDLAKLPRVMRIEMVK